MVVSDLIGELQKLPADAEVVLQVDGIEYSRDISSIEHRHLHQFRSNVVVIFDY